LKKLDYLESLRGLAALVVVFSHYAVAFYPALFWAKAEQVHTEQAVEIFISGTPLNLLYNGDFSVCIFFVLSGFVLTYRFFRDRNAEVLLVPLAAKRYARLLVPVFFSMALAFLLLKLSLYFSAPASVITKSSDWLAGFWQFSPDFRTMLRQSFFGVFFSREYSYNNVLWTMTYEFYGSMIVFAFVAFFRNYRRRFIPYILFMIIFHRVYYLAFIFGMLLSDVNSRENNFLKKIGTSRPFIVLLLTGLFLGSYPMRRPLEGTLYAFMPHIAQPRMYHVLGAFLVMTAVLHLRPLQALLSKKPFVFLGKISFSQYILHFLIITSLSCYLLLMLTPHFSYNAAVLMTICLSLPVIMAASHYSYKYVDMSGIKLSQMVYSYLLRLRRKYEIRRLVTRHFRSKQQDAPECASSAQGDEGG
jgi:peptidoglycan/LPS O-acetylase OafA/YrhL